MMGHRTGTPMRLVSPAPVAPVLVPGTAPRPPQIYQPAQQGTPQTIYSQQSNNNVGGKRLEALYFYFTFHFCFIHQTI